MLRQTIESEGNEGITLRNNVAIEILLTDRARMAGQLNKPEDRHVEGSKRK
jgi:hypothetical protein